jgi:integrase
MHVRLKGLNPVRKKLADGTIKLYYYPTREKGNTALPGKIGSPEFVNAYNEAVARKKAAPTDILLSLLQAYQASTTFTDLADRTKRDYVRLIKIVEAEWGDYPLKLLSDMRTRAKLLEWRDGVAKQSTKKADYLWTVLALILKWAKNRGLIAINPAERGGRVHHGTRVDSIWSDEDEARFLKTAHEYRMDKPFLMAIWTGQREGDLIRLQWSQYDGTYLRLRQSKTGKPVVIPVGKPLKAILDASERRGDTILTSPRGLQWDQKNLQKRFKDAMRRAGIADRTFHDLRGTAITRLANMGVSIPDIASLTGHSLASVHAILQRHYLHLGVEGAERAIQALEKRADNLQTGLQTDIKSPEISTT